MDLHPLVVHFPIALLTIYSLLEIAALHSYFRRPERTHAKLVFLFIGTLWALTALSTGENAARLYNDPTLILALHKASAGLSSGVYKGITIFYLIQLALQTSTFVRIFAFPQLLTILNTLITVVQRRRIPALAALIALGSLSLTGALGGILVYGPSGDPITQFVYDNIQTLEKTYNLSQFFDVESEKD